MKQNKISNVTIKWIISIILSIGTGTFIMNILENIELNVWFARIIGAIVSVIIGLIFYYL